MQIRRRVVHAWLVAWLFALLAGCSGDTPETRLRADVDAMEAAVQARDAGALKELLAEDFVGNEGLAACVIAPRGG